jgi:hypothetical protein
MAIGRHEGYQYNYPETGEPMTEYHEDTCNLFQKGWTERQS